MIVAKAIQQKLSQYDYVYLGDTKRVPYGNRTYAQVYRFTREGIEYLLKKEKCGLVIVACNTASARALRRIQQKYLPKKFPGRKVIGVLIPAAEEAAKFSRIGVLATSGTVASKSFFKEIRKINPRAKIFQKAAPELVPLIEEGRTEQAGKFLRAYVKPLLQKKIETLVLGCTHYPIWKAEFKKILPNRVKIISQDDIVPKKLKAYLARHPEISKKLSRKGSAKILVTDVTENVMLLSRKWFGNAAPKLVRL